LSFPVEEVWVNRKVVKIILRGVRDRPGVAAEVFELLAARGINVELIVAGPASKGKTDIAFLILESQTHFIKESEDILLEEIGGTAINYDPKVALIVFYGSKELSKKPGVAARIFNILAEAGVNIEMVSTSLDSISIVVREHGLDRAIAAITDALGVEVEEGY